MHKYICIITICHLLIFSPKIKALIATPSSQTECKFTIFTTANTLLDSAKTTIFINNICDSLHIPLQYAFIPYVIIKDSTFCKKVGHWALSVSTAKHYGLIVNTHYDERFDFKKATVAALSYIADLHSIYNNTWLTFIAYIQSPAALNNYMIHTQGNIPDICHIREISSSLAYQLDNFYHLIASTSTLPLPLAWDTQQKHTSIKLNTPIYKHIFLKELNISADSLQQLNPCLRLQNNTLSADYEINIPEYTTFIPDSLYFKNLQYTDSIAQAQILEKQRKQTDLKRDLAVKKYKVKAGDTLGHIALKYGVSVRALKKWNSLRSDMLQIGQTIKIYN